LSILFDLERTNQLSLLPDKDLVDLCLPIEPYQVTKSQRNLGYIDQLIELGASLTCLSKRQYKMLLVIEEVSRQQREMWSEKKTRVDQRIVSLSQPHVRPIVRGKAGKPTEFGAKLSVSCVDNYVFLHRLSWENFNESQDLKAQVENFKET
jgi:IS5 family transposase